MKTCKDIRKHYDMWICSEIEQNLRVGLSNLLYCVIGQMIYEKMNNTHYSADVSSNLSKTNSIIFRIHVEVVFEFSFRYTVIAFAICRVSRESNISLEVIES